MAHSRPASDTGPRQIEIFEEEGVDLSRVQIAHTGDSDDLDYIERVLDKGVFIGLDRYGLDLYLPFDKRQATIRELLSRGHIDRLLLGQDFCATIDWFPEEAVAGLIEAGHRARLEHDAAVGAGLPGAEGERRPDRRADRLDARRQCAAVDRRRVERVRVLLLAWTCGVDSRRLLPCRVTGHFSRCRQGAGGCGATSGDPSPFLRRVCVASSPASTCGERCAPYSGSNARLFARIGSRATR